jgi:hypothetical protein
VELFEQEKSTVIVHICVSEQHVHQIWGKFFDSEIIAPWRIGEIRDLEEEKSVESVRLMKASPSEFRERAKKHRESVPKFRQ